LYNELDEANHYIEQLEDELLRMKQSRKALQNNIKVLLDGNKKLMSQGARLKKERDSLKKC
jgi:predicted  nucleic acid-binding Zn-ribbon protein